MQVDPPSPSPGSLPVQVVGERGEPWTRWATRAFVAVVLLSLIVLFSPRTPSTGGIYGVDKVVHCTLFGLLAATTRWRFGRGLPWVIGYAVLSEVLQATLPISRDGDPFDALADSVGACAGWWLARRLTST